jgi:hypothetical protein
MTIYRIHQKWSALMEAFDQMRNDFSLAASVREKVDEFYKITSSKNFLMQYFFSF